MSAYSWSYAPTNRATCKGKCKEKIAKGAVRLCTAADIPDGHSMQQYRCLDCVTDKQIANIIVKCGTLDKVEGFDDLSAEDQAAVLAKGGAAPASPKLAAPKAAGRAPPAAPARAAPKKEPSIAEQHSFLDKAKEYEFDAVRELLEAEPALINVAPLGRWSALHQFASAGMLDAVKCLLEKGADPMIKNKDGATPRDVAHDKCKKTLLDAMAAAEKPAARVAAPVRGKASDKAEDMEVDEEKAAPAAGSKRKAPEAASPVAKKAKAGIPVDSSVPSRSDYSVVDDWSVLLNQTNVGANNNKFYKIQVLQSGGSYYCWTHWGRVGSVGQFKLDSYGSQDAAEKEFKSKFKQKSGVNYDMSAGHDWTPKVGKYTLVETDDQEGAESSGSAPLGKLTAAQIEKGQGVLEQLDAALKKKDTKKLDDLSSQYYTLVPHDFGMKKPPTLNTAELLEAEEELLKFYLRMGFEEIEKEDAGLTPVSGIMSLDLPKSLDAACSKVCGAADIKLSNEKGKAHSSKQSGGPTSMMEAHLYGSIMLYTSNAIYKKLNAVLRSEDRASIKKFFPYLRLLLEAFKRLPQNSKTLWRGVTVDLYDQYPVGSTQTWWGVSSCTADQDVARKFMKGCGGKCTLLTVKTKTAADISEITFFGNEKENLLAPGTQLKVLSSSRKGNITEITLQEVGRVLD